ncbi:MAG: ABC transporter permease [Candidatus Bathyarchaeota archaeon]|nr:ABC transporter permease [Candidatus Bathyarchaeota archaeon]MDH5745342.1 ABC transporter permease [Candidatus Bathyarchaeota archaeon]
MLSKNLIISFVGDMSRFWRRYKKNRGGVVGLLFLAFVVILAIAAPAISTYDPTKTGVGGIFAEPSSTHLLGTDHLGRDIYSRLLVGARVALLVSFLAAGISAVIGSVVGAIGGYFGGIVDHLLSKVTEIFQVIPMFFLALLLLTIFGGSQWIVISTIGVLGWPSIARVTRGEFIREREKEYVQAAFALGASNLDIALFEIFLNVLPPIIISTCFVMSSAMLTEAALSFLGISDPSIPSWGRMIGDARLFLFRDVWWVLLPPALMLCITTIGINLIGDALNRIIR